MMEKFREVVDVSKAEASIGSQQESNSDHGSRVDKLDTELERKLLWKIDLHLLPILFVFYMLSYLDRINIGNAAIQGMNTELLLNIDNRFNIALLVFYSLYIPLEIPSNMLLKYCRPSIYLPTLMFLWGIITMCTGFVRTYQSLYALRVLLGLFEAGLVPGVVYVTSMYYRRFEYQKRLSFMFVATSFGGAFGGLLAYGIADLNGREGYLGWRWIFIIEGAITCFIALLSPLVLLDWPEQCRLFSENEKRLIRLRLADDIGNFRMDTLDRHALWRIVTDWKIYLGALMYFGLTTSGLAMSFFLPTVLVEYGWKAQEAQIRTIPVYVVVIGLTLIIAFLSDRLQHRYGFIMFCCLLTTIGYGMVLHVEELSRDAKYAACFLIAAGGICSGPIAITFLANNIAGHLKRATGSALQVSFGGLAGIVGSVMFKASDSPVYKTGFSVGLAMGWVSGIAATAMAIGVVLENRKRDRGERNNRLLLDTDQINNLGDDHPAFRFTL